MIRLKNIEKSYEAGGGKTFVLRNINFELKANEFVTFMGPPAQGSPRSSQFWECSTQAGAVNITWKITRYTNSVNRTGDALGEEC